MKLSVLIAVNDSVISRAVIERFKALPFSLKELHITLVHVFRKASASEQLIAKEVMDEKLKKFQQILLSTKEDLAENGFSEDQIQIRLVETPYQTVSDGLIDQFQKGAFDMIVIGRKRMSKAEEFVMGDPSIKLVRALENSTILIVK